MASFEVAKQKVGVAEGGYANNPNDSGGETYRGIARNFHPKWPGWAIIDRIKPGKTAAQINVAGAKIPELNQVVISFYKGQFWDVLRLDEFENQTVAGALYDFGVNAHPTTALKYLQEAINICHKKPVLVVDGKIGPQTLKVINGYPKTAYLLKVFAAIKSCHRINRIREKPNQVEFAESWINRDFSYLL